MRDYNLSLYTLKQKLKLIGSDNDEPGADVASL